MFLKTEDMPIRAVPFARSNWVISGMLLAGCFLMRHGIAVESTVLGMIQQLRRYTPDAENPSRETAGQQKMVLNWKRGR